jgi:hypothetical protein
LVNSGSAVRAFDGNVFSPRDPPVTKDIQLRRFAAGFMVNYLGGSSRGAPKAVSMLLKHAYYGAFKMGHLYL